MPDEQPDARELADALERRSPVFDKMPSVDVAVRVLRTQHASIARKNALLRQALEALLPEAIAHTTETKQTLVVAAIKQELSQ